MNKRTIVTLPTLLLLAATALLPQSVSAHCEVPCGIYDDQLRFQSMLEDATTVGKAVDELGKLVTEMAESATPLAVNQASRWVTTKEDHATRIQQTIAQYFLTQRIKPDAENYVDQLKAAHAVMQAAMKAKQDASAEKVTALRESILDLYRAYEGKEPAFASHTH